MSEREAFLRSAVREFEAVHTRLDTFATGGPDPDIETIRADVFALLELFDKCVQPEHPVIVAAREIAEMLGTDPNAIHVQWARPEGTRTDSWKAGYRAAIEDAISGNIEHWPIEARSALPEPKGDRE